MGHISELLGQNGAQRYVFTIHSKTKHGVAAGGSFIVSYFPGDQAAITFADWLETHVLANYARVAVSKTIRMANNEEVPVFGPMEDEQTVKLLLGTSEDRDVRVSVRMPKLKVGLPSDWAENLSAAGMQTYKGQPLDRIISMSATLQNIASLGAAKEPGF